MVFVRGCDRGFWVWFCVGWWFWIFRFCCGFVGLLVYWFSFLGCAIDASGWFLNVVIVGLMGILTFDLGGWIVYCLCFEVGFWLGFGLLFGIYLLFGLLDLVGFTLLFCALFGYFLVAVNSGVLVY